MSLQLLVSYPSLSFVTMVIDTLTHLAIATLVQVPDQVRGPTNIIRPLCRPFIEGLLISSSDPSLSLQVWLLLSYAERDARRLVRCCALANLLKLALRAPQCWTSPMMEVPRCSLTSCVSTNSTGIAQDSCQ